MAHTRTEWYADDNKRHDLAKLLESSPLKEAIEVIVFENLPEADSRIAANDAVANALQNKEREGFFRFLKELRGLTEAPRVAQETAQVQPWEHVKRRPPIRTALK